MSDASEYLPLSPESLPGRIAGIEGMQAKVGPDPASWKTREVGDGNLNLVFIATGSLGSAVIKQALPYVRLVGDSWPLPLNRSYFEHAALTRQAERDPGRVPEIYHFDRSQALIVMEYLSPHVILRKKLVAGERVEGLGMALGNFCARTAFRGSDLSIAASKKKADAALFAGNVELMAITESLVFTDPYFGAEMNHHTEGLESAVSRLRQDTVIKMRAQDMLMSFTANAETLCHGDLHTGSVMCTDSETKIIDPEFAFYGPMGFDLGMLVANFLMAYFSQPGHRDSESLDRYQEWILTVVEEVVNAFEAEFARLWDSERTGILYPRSVFEDQGHSSQPAMAALLARIWRDALMFCGIEMHRRVLSLAHNADFEEICAPSVRAPLEARNLAMGRFLVVHGHSIRSPATLTAIARRYNGETHL